MNLEIIWLSKYPGWQEILMTMDLDFLVLSFERLHNIEYSSYAIMTNTEYPFNNYIILRIYKRNQYLEH